MRIARQEHQLRLLEERIRSYSPDFLLQRGYTFTTLHGKRITSAAELKPGDRLRTYFPDGAVDSEVVEARKVKV